jgi:hypothetical protein
VKELEALRREFFREHGIVEKLRAALPGFEEWEPYGNYTEEEKKKRLTSGALAGSRGISMQVGILLSNTYRRCSGFVGLLGWTPANLSLLTARVV